MGSLLTVVRSLVFQKYNLRMKDRREQTIVYLGWININTEIVFVLFLAYERNKILAGNSPPPFQPLNCLPPSPINPNYLIIQVLKCRNNTCKRPCILELLNIGRSFTGGSCNKNDLDYIRLAQFYKYDV